MKNTKHIKRAMIALDMSQPAFAKKVGVSQGLVSQWLLGNKRPGWSSAKKIEAATNGIVTCHDVRPDIFPAPTQASSQAA